MSIVDALRDALAAEPGVRLALLFGSVADGSAHAGSDVDVALLAPGVNLLELAQRLEERLGKTVDVVDLTAPTVPLLEELVRHAVVVHESEPGGGSLWRSRTLATLETDRPWFARMNAAFLRRWGHREAGRGPT